MKWLHFMNDKLKIGWSDHQSKHALYLRRRKMNQGDHRIYPAIRPSTKRTQWIRCSASSYTLMDHYKRLLQHNSDSTTQNQKKRNKKKKTKGDVTTIKTQRPIPQHPLVTIHRQYSKREFIINIHIWKQIQPTPFNGGWAGVVDRRGKRGVCETDKLRKFKPVWLAMEKSKKGGQRNSDEEE